MTVSMLAQASTAVYDFRSDTDAKALESHYKKKSAQSEKLKKTEAYNFRSAEDTEIFMKKTGQKSDGKITSNEIYDIQHD